MFPHLTGVSGTGILASLFCYGCVVTATHRKWDDALDVWGTNTHLTRTTRPTHAPTHTHTYHFTLHTPHPTPHIPHSTPPPHTHPTHPLHLSPSEGVHGMGGALGSVLVGFFADDSVGGVSASAELVGKQLAAVAFTAAYSYVVTIGRPCSLTI